MCGTVCVCEWCVCGGICVYVTVVMVYTYHVVVAAGVCMVVVTVCVTGMMCVVVGVVCGG